MKQAQLLGSASEYEALIAGHDPIILYFFTPDCGVCHAMLPKLLEALDQDPIDVIEIDAARFPAIAGQQRIFVAPTVLVTVEGKEILRESRFIDIPKISRLLSLMR